MRDLSVTIVEEHTKRLSRNLALKQTRRRTITFDNPPGSNHVLEISSDPNSKTTIIRPGKSVCTATTTTKTQRSLRPAKDPVTSTVTTTTVEVPYKNFRIWTDYDREDNFELHIKEQKSPKERPDKVKGASTRDVHTI